MQHETVFTLEAEEERPARLTCTTASDIKEKIHFKLPLFGNKVFKQRVPFCLHLIVDW